MLLDKGLVRCLLRARLAQHPLSSLALPPKWGSSVLFGERPRQRLAASPPGSQAQRIGLCVPQ